MSAVGETTPSKSSSNSTCSPPFVLPVMCRGHPVKSKAAPVTATAATPPTNCSNNTVKKKAPVVAKQPLSSSSSESSSSSSEGEQEEDGEDAWQDEGVNTPLKKKKTASTETTYM